PRPHAHLPFPTRRSSDLAAGADLAYVGSAFLATKEANITTEYRQMVVDSSAADVVYSDYFTGIHGNYLRDSIIAAGYNPDSLPEIGRASCRERRNSGVSM